MSQLWILFGKSGAGKNFVAELLAREFGYDWYDADRDLTPEMMHAIRHQLEFTMEMRNRYFEIVVQRLNERLRANGKVAVTQGLFKNQNRHDLSKEYPFAQWIWVEADKKIIAERVLYRNSIVTPEYARRINQFFEAPDFPCFKIINNRGASEILTQTLSIEKDYLSSAVFPESRSQLTMKEEIANAAR